MKIKTIGAAAFLSALLTGPAAFADDNLKFTIHNDSDYIIASFQTNEGHGWSNNWLKGDEVHAGDSTALKFLRDGPCKIQVRVGWRTKDGGQEVSDPWNIDICDAKNVYFDGHKVTYD